MAIDKLLMGQELNKIELATQLDYTPNPITRYGRCDPISIVEELFLKRYNSGIVQNKIYDFIISVITFI